MIWNKSVILKMTRISSHLILILLITVSKWHYSYSMQQALPLISSRLYLSIVRTVGLDIAFIANGYVYHTPFDVPEMIPSGCIQRAGEERWWSFTVLFPIFTSTLSVCLYVCPSVCLPVCLSVQKQKLLIRDWHNLIYTSSCKIIRFG